LGTTLWYRGEFAAALTHLEAALADDHDDRDPDLASRFGQAPGVTAMVWLALALWPLGEPDRARALADRAMARAAETGHVPSIVYVHNHTASLEMMRGDLERTIRLAEALIDLCDQHGLTAYLAYARVYLCWARRRRDEPRDGLTRMRHEVDQLRQRGIRLGLHRCLTMLAEVELEAGEIDAALASIDAGLAITRQTGEHWYEAEIHRIRGDILLRREPMDVSAAEQAFAAALSIARRQGAPSFALRAALALAQLLRGTGREAEAAAVLAPALEGFRPSPELPEIEQAQDLMTSLVSKPTRRSDPLTRDAARRGRPRPGR
jgi:predicted ATPase